MQRAKLKHRLKQKMPDKARIRRANNKWNRLGVVGLILFSTAIPLLTMIQDVKAYQLTPQTLNVIGKANPNLSAKFKFNAENNSWEFNQDGAALSAASQKQVNAAALAQLQAQVGGGGKHDTTLYSASLAADPTKGVTYYDNNTQLSFSMVPNFSMREGKFSQGRVVYPFADGGQLVYTAKANGLKEDLVLSHNIGDWLRFSYKLNLPSTLEARVESDGSIGVYSADPALFGNITFGSDVDQAKIMDARVNAPKNNLVFVIPAPIIKDKIGQVSTATYALDNDQLIVTADGLSKLHYPLSVDPSVVVTSTSDFTTGNNEDNISYSTSNQASRAGVTGATISGGWSSTTAMSQGRFAQGTAIYNGYLYQISGSGASGSIEYAQLNSNGTITSWTNVTGTLSQDIYYGGAFAYNGYLYIIGGYGNTTGTALSSVLYAKLNSNGSFGAWSTSSNAMATAVCRAGTAVYGGYVYVTGGASTPGTGCDNTSTGLLNTTQYAPLLANGDIGAWSTSASTFTNARMGHSTVAYNGYLYVIAGTTNGTTRYTTTQYAKILSSGDISSWTTSSNNLSASIYATGATVYNGCIYLAGGTTTASQTTVQLAQVNANGTINKWQTTTSLGTANFASGVAAYNGYLYDAGGSGTTTNVNYAAIDIAGQPGNYTSGSQINTVAITGGQSFVFANRIFLVGGFGPSSDYTTNVLQAPLNSDGTVGTWASTTSMGTAEGGCAFAFYNGYIYCVGGFVTGGSTISTAQYAKVNTDGTLTWSTTTALPVTVGNHSGAAYGGYMFVISGGGAGNSANVYAAPINSNGTLGTWTLQTNNLNTSRNQEGLVAFNGRLYVIGGATSGSNYLTSVERSTIDTTPATAATVLGSFSTTTSLNTARGNQFGITVSGGYVYVAGGSNNVGDINTVEFAKFNSTGSLGTWNTYTMTNTQKSFSMAVNSDVLYLVSGNIAGSRDKHTNYLFLNNGGSGKPTSKTSITAMGTARAYHQSVAYNGYLYVAGGKTTGGTYQNDIQYAAIAADGTIGSWSAATNLPSARSDFGLVAYGGNMYVLGGNESGSAGNDVQHTAINSNGSLGGSWTSDNTFTTARYAFGAVAYNGYMYVMGGYTGSVYQADVQYVAINSDGSLGAWASTNSFTTGRSGGMIAAAYGGYMYIGGGYNGAALGDVQIAALNSDGTIGTFDTTIGFPGTIYNTTSSAYNGSLCVYSGNRTLGNSTADGSEVLCSKIGVNGNLEGWQQSFVTAGPASSPYTVSAAVAVYQGNAYYTGGITSGTTYATAGYVLGLDTTSRVAHYSTLIDLGTTATISSVYYNVGSIYNTSMQYKIAGTNGVLGSSSAATVGTGSEPPGVCTQGSDQYVWISMTLDDSNGSIYTDSSGANITDIHVYYGASSRPTPPQRLHGGKFFTSEVLQPLDTCG
jgi:hypothetical protein